jgi:hypothetical protein
MGERERERGKRERRKARGMSLRWGTGRWAGATILRWFGRPSKLQFARFEGILRPMLETDLLRLTWLADPQISPDGSRIAFVRVTVDTTADGT